jgi:hypothetical protein
VSSVFTPDNSTPLLLAQEDETGLSASVTVTSDDPLVGVESLSYSASPPFPPQVSVSVVANVLTVSIPNFVDFFPIQEIRYLLDGVPGTCLRFADLPPAAEDVIRYVPSSLSFRDFTLTVTAELEGGAQESMDYIITVFANYSLGRALLVAAVDARR